MGCGGNATALQDQTSLASHELAETITDPEIGLVTGFTYAFPAGWGDNNNNCGEIADICDDGSPGSTITVAGRAWVVQPFWSNRMRACVSSEPARPSSTISWANPSPITYGTPLSSVQLNASAGVTGTFVYSPVAGAVLPAGPQTLSVQFTPDDPANYTLSSATATLQVNQATPVITWPTPPPIGLGTPLTGAQLNASANVPGTFVYIPPSGTVPPLGVQTLGVQFSPSDTTNYRSTSASVTLQVNLPPSSLTGVSVTASGLAYSRVSQMFIGTVTVRNISATTIAGPLEILFATLPSGVTLVNATGALGGLPYLTWPGAGLAPGQSATVSVQFRNPGNVQINCTPVIYSGSF
ncbi:hypothetical protein SBA3_1740007 [Candidatus Sulfopaludibacter sp. SbA3]|nr:hypothetical protein SBA3_1740007 [Candidatus Sulfopaludibacter sp. SbA3]